MNALLEYLERLPKPWAFHIMARFTRGRWWELEVRLTPHPGNREGSDVSKTLFRWSELSLDEMATRMIPEIAKEIA